MPVVLPAVLLLAVALMGAAKPDAGFQLYLLIGQSNMAGRGKVDTASQPDDARIRMLDRERRWVTAHDPMHFDKAAAGVGPGLAFAQRLLQARPQARIGLIPCAVGGTSIRAWVPGAADAATKTHPYDDMLVRLRAAQADGVLKAALWHQGESDRSRAAEYPAELTALVQRLRADAGIPDLPVIAGEIASFRPDSEAPTAAFNAALRSLEGRIPAFAVIGCAGTRDGGDHLHFDAASARLLGQRYAERLLQMGGR